MTRIQLAAPCCLTLAAARLDGGPALLGIALQHPPVQLEARPAAELSITGARADAAYAHAARLEERLGVTLGAELEIELAVPSHMGLGSDAMVGLGAARALAALHDLPAAGLAPDDGLAAHAFAAGGLLAVDEGGRLLRRHAIAHSEETHDWVFVLVLPRVPPGTPADLEAARRRELWREAAALDAEAERLTGGELWPAAEAGDIAAFASALARLQSLGPAPTLGAAERATLALMAEHGALVWGRAPAGLALYGLIEGADPSRALRRALGRHLGYESGIVLATICDTSGAQLLF